MSASSTRRNSSACTLSAVSLSSAAAASAEACSYCRCFTFCCEARSSAACASAAASASRAATRSAARASASSALVTSQNSSTLSCTAAGGEAGHARRSTKPRGGATSSLTPSARQAAGRSRARGAWRSTGAFGPSKQQFAMAHPLQLRVVAVRRLRRFGSLSRGQRPAQARRLRRSQLLGRRLNLALALAGRRLGASRHGSAERPTSDAHKRRPAAPRELRAAPEARGGELRQATRPGRAEHCPRAS